MRLRLGEAGGEVAEEFAAERRSLQLRRLGLAGADDVRRHAGQPRRVEAVRLGARPRRELVQERDSLDPSLLPFVLHHASLQQQTTHARLLSHGWPWLSDLICHPTK